MKKKKVMQLVTLLSVATIPLWVSVGCGFTDTIRCTTCGDNDTRVGLYASGTESNIEYKSCVGPAGILGFGCDSSCWPTECLKIKWKKDSSTTLSGCIYYYNDWGCIGNSSEESKGTYSENVTCLGIPCTGEKYTESETTNGVSASGGSSCFGISCGSSETDSKDYNSQMPRQFMKGCWSCK